ncbi:MAG: hypothetical protein ACE5E0_01085, partial [Terriglobia bacterium]
MRRGSAARMRDSRRCGERKIGRVGRQTATVMMLAAVLLSGSANAVAALSYDDVFYVAPIVTQVNLQNILDMKNRLGPGGPYAQLGFSASTFYMNETTGRANDFEFDPAALNKTISLSKLTNLPVVIYFNGGPWGNLNLRPDQNLIVHLEKDPDNCQWRADNTVPADDEYQLGVGRLLTYNNLNRKVRSYRERNFRAAAKIVADFYRERPDLLLAVNTDPEVFMSPYYYAD